MTTYIKDLKEDNGDIVYPHTNTDAVYTTTNETLETRISKYVTAEDIAQSVQSFGTVTTGMLDDDAVTTAKIDDEAVTTAKIDDGAVTTAKLATGAVTSSNIDWSSITSPEFPVVSTATSNNNVNSNVWYGQYQYTIPETGVYLAMFSQRMTGGNNGNDFRVRITLDDVELVVSSSGGSSWVNYITPLAFAVFQATKNSVLKCQSTGGGSGAYATQYGQVAITRLR